MPLEFSCTNEEKVIGVTFAPTTSTGKPAQTEGAPTVSVMSGEGMVGTNGTATTLPDLISGDNPGDTVYLVEADADLGAGVVTISDTITLKVAGAMATNLGLSGGTVAPK